MRTQHLFIKARVHFVVLLVGFVRKNGHWGGVRIVEVLFGELGIGFAVIGEALLESFAAEVADACPDDEVGNQTALG